MTELEKALCGMRYASRDPEVVQFQNNVKDLCFELGRLKPSDPQRSEIIAELLGTHNPYLRIEPGFQCTFGRNIHFKGMAMVNYNCTFLDSQPITIGDMTLIGPGSSIICTNHSVNAEERLNGLFDDKPITIGDCVWLGANVTVCPGVTIGDNSVIGAGSVVTKDVPPNVVAAGNPCRVIRPVTEDDRLDKKKKYDLPKHHYL